MAWASIAFGLRLRCGICKKSILSLVFPFDCFGLSEPASSFFAVAYFSSEDDIISKHRNKKLWKFLLVTYTQYAMRGLLGPDPYKFELKIENNRGNSVSRLGAAYVCFWIQGGVNQWIGLCCSNRLLLAVGVRHTKFKIKRILLI